MENRVQLAVLNNVERERQWVDIKLPGLHCAQRKTVADFHIVLRLQLNFV